MIKKMTIDFHTHIFPDAVALHAIPALEAKAAVKAALNGTVHDLLQSMDRHHISQSVVCSIATTPQQFPPILDWSQAMATDRIIPLPSVHPASASVLEELQTIHDHGFLGIKLHPDYQDFFLDEDRLLPLFEKCAELGLFIVLHCGYDIGFPKEERANPQQIKHLITTVPSLKL
ncbi:MAG: amidohydrolase family protein, partial [Spirochaetales bacterium]|nr:amidohydrolase family protein [Spirochaetales bacterium]